MRSGRSLVAIVIMAGLSLPIQADQSKAAYSKGVKAEEKGDYDAAYNFFNEAYTLSPKNTKYFSTYIRVRFTAGSQHVHAGEMMRDRGALGEALAQFQRALEIDPSSGIARQEVQRTTKLIEEKKHPPAAPPPSPLILPSNVGGPLELKPFSNAPITMYLTANADAVYKTIGKIAGFNVIVDPDYKPQKITVDLTNVTLRQALEMVRLESKTFWRPVLDNAIYVTMDSPAKRKDIEQSVMKTFYLRNIETSNELQEAANVVKQMLDVSRIQLVQAQDALILRGTPDQMLLAEKLLTDFDQPKSEVVIDVAVMEVSRDRIRTLGNNVPTSFSGALTPPASSGSGGSSGGFTLNQLKSLNSGSLVLGLGGASLSLLASDSNTKVLQNPEIRVLNNEKATLRIGDRVPYATGSFSPGAVGGGGISPLVSTQFQYLDVGVNIDITPHIHSNGEITLKMSLEISSVSGEQSIGGITEPVIGQRRIEHEARLTDGEVNLLGGILEDTETQSMSGYPWLSKIPILRYLFAQDNRERQENEIVFAITPHIVRSQTLTDDNTRIIEVGTGSSIELRREQPLEINPKAARLTETSSGAAPILQPATGSQAVTPQPAGAAPKTVPATQPSTPSQSVPQAPTPPAPVVSTPNTASKP